MSSSDIDRVRASFKRCTDQMEFIDSFYQRLMESSPEVTAKFKSVDMDHQAVMLRGSLEMMLSAIDAESPRRSLQALANLHGRGGANVPPHLYDYWLGSLMATVRVYDQECDAELLRTWERVLAPGIEYMKRAY